MYLSVVSSLLLSIRQVFFIYWPNPLAPLAIDDDLMLWVFFQEITIHKVGYHSLTNKKKLTTALIRIAINVENKNGHTTRKESTETALLGSCIENIGNGNLITSRQGRSRGNNEISTENHQPKKKNRKRPIDGRNRNQIVCLLIPFPCHEKNESDGHVERKRNDLEKTVLSFLFLKYHTAIEK